MDGEQDDLSISPRPDALVLFNPVTDFRESQLKAMMAGNTDEERTKYAELISAVVHLKAGDPPAIVFYGDEDEFLKNGRQYIRKYLELKNHAELWTAKGQPHGFFNATPWHEATLRKSDEFLASLGYLAGPATIQPSRGEGTLIKDLP